MTPEMVVALIKRLDDVFDGYMQRADEAIDNNANSPVGKSMCMQAHGIAIAAEIVREYAAAAGILTPLPAEGGK